MAEIRFNRRLPSNEKGAAAVEFAIILPLLLLLILLLLDFGRIFFVQISLNSASREAARGSSLSMTTNQVSALAEKSAVGVAALASLGTSQLVVVPVQTCNTTSPLLTLPPDTTLVTVEVNFKWITPVQLVKIFAPNSSLVQVGGMKLLSRGMMLCADS